MLKTLKYLAVLITLLVVIIATLPFIIDPNDFRDDIASAVSDATGRDFNIEGELQLSVFPWLGIATGPVTLGNRDGFGEQTFAHVESTQLRVKLIPLLKKQVEMDTVVLAGLELNLQRRPDGTDNWSDLAGGKPATAATTDSSKPALSSLAIGGVTIKQARISYRDAVSGRNIKLDKLNLETGTLVAAKPVSVSLNTNLESNQPAARGSLAIKTRLRADVAAGQYQLDGSRIEVNLLGDTLPGGRLKAALDADIQADLKAQTVTVSKLVLDSAPLRTTGQLALGRIDTATPSLDGQLGVATFNPRELFARLGITSPQTADPGVLKQASFKTRLGGNLEHIKLDELELALDDTAIRGNIALLNKQRLQANYDLQLDSIDLDRYLPGPAAQQGRGFDLIATAVADTAPAELFPVELLRSFDMQGKLAAQRVTMNRLNIDNLRTSVLQRNGLLQLDPVNGTAYGGSYTGHIKIDARRQHGNTALVSVDESLKGINIGPVVKALTDKEPIKGSGDVSAKLATRGQSVNELKRSLNGTIDIALKDGAINGIDVTQIIRDTYAKYKGRAATESGEGKTPFTSMDVTFNVKNGVMHSNNLRLASALPLLRGVGSIDLNALTLDYLLKTSIDKTLVDLVDLDPKLVGLPLRVRLHGPLANVDYDIDWIKLVGRAVEKTQKDKLLNKLLGREPEPKPEPKPESKPESKTAPAAEQPAEPPREETRKERKKRERKEKEEAIKGLLKGLF